VIVYLIGYAMKDRFGNSGIGAATLVLDHPVSYADIRKAQEDISADMMGSPTILVTAVSELPGGMGE
jgi:hypothetical protein